MLFEVKTLHFGSSTYPTAEARFQAVADKAAWQPGEYARKARNIDRLYCGTAQGDTGPVEQRLRDFEPVKGLVFGHFGEASPDAHKLIAVLAAAGAQRRLGRGIDEDEQQTVRGALAWRFKRS